MKATNQAKLLKIWSYPVRWSRGPAIVGGNQFVAMYRGRGMKVTLRAEAKKHDIMQMARQVKDELVAADKGELDAETEKLWARQEGEHLDSQPPADDPRGN